MTHWTLPIGLFATLLAAAAAQDEYQLASEPPRLFLNARRLRLLERERERDSIRWQAFHALLAGRANMPEPGFALALYGKVARDTGACREAAAWAAKAAKADDVRQAALVFDWCGPNPALERKLRQALAKPATAIPAVRDQTLAAIALGHAPTLRRVVEEWWPQGPLREVRQGRMPFATPPDVFALAEILHAVRDNLNLDLREDAAKFFAALPPALLLRYYPAPWPAAENLYRIPAYLGARDPSLTDAALARAADLALTAFDTNATPNQFLQGWLMNDRYLLRSPYGLPYEFLWANPYQPGLSYYHLPDVFHGSGRLYVRSSWDEDAAWFGYWDGQAQWFANGARAAAPLKPGQAPLRVGPSTVAVGPAPLRFETTGQETGGREEYAFAVLLAPATSYDVEVDDEEMFEAATDAAGILALTFPAGRKTWVRVHAARSGGAAAALR